MPVQTMPSVLTKVPNVPFCTVTSALPKSCTFSLKVMVSVVVSPA